MTSVSDVILIFLSLRSPTPLIAACDGLSCELRELCEPGVSHDNDWKASPLRISSYPRYLLSSTGH